MVDDALIGFHAAFCFDESDEFGVSVAELSGLHAWNDSFEGHFAEIPAFLFFGEERKFDFFSSERRFGIVSLIAGGDGFFFVGFELLDGFRRRFDEDEIDAWADFVALRIGHVAVDVVSNVLGERIVDGNVRDGRKELNQLVSVFDERVNVEITYVNVHFSIIYCGAGIFLRDIIFFLFRELETKNRSIEGGDFLMLRSVDDGLFSPLK